MDAQPLSFSVIIPAYNSEGYIARALDSVKRAGASGADYEVIVVDDGSTDGTANLVRERAQKNPRIKLHTKPNGNWGSVVNYVKDRRLATKEYSLILDSDDALSKGCFANAAKRMRGADVLLMSFTMRERRFSLRVSPYMFVSRDVKPAHRFSMQFAPFCEVFRTKLFYDHAPRLREGVRYQDPILFHTLLRAAKTVRYTLYSAGTYYRWRPGNTMHAPWDDKRFAEEKMLHADMRAAGFDEFLPWRCLLFGYCKKAREQNYLIPLSFRPKPLSQPWWLHPLYWVIYACKMRRYVKVEPPSGGAEGA